MFRSPVNAIGSLLIALLFQQNSIRIYCQAQLNPFSFPLSGMTPLAANPMEYSQPMYHLPQDKTELIVLGDRGGNQQHHHHHHHHHKNVHHHHHGHKHSHGHNHNHDHKHGHDHNHGHNHNHDHRHAHGHKHLHSHGHDHLHNHGHKHDHKHGHIPFHKYNQDHSQNFDHIYQQGDKYNENHRNNNGQHQVSGNRHGQHYSKVQVIDHEQANQQQEHYDSEYSNQVPPIKVQKNDNQYTSNNNQLKHKHNNLQHKNYATKYPDHVPPFYVSINNGDGNSQNENNNNIQQQNFDVHDNKPEQGDVDQSRYEQSASNENAYYEQKQEKVHNTQKFSHENENSSDEKVIKKDSSSSDQGDLSPRFRFNNKALITRANNAFAPGNNYNHRYRNSNNQNDRAEQQRLKKMKENSDELFVEPQEYLGVRVRHKKYGDYHKKEASISTVSFLQDNGDLITVDNDDPFLSVERPLRLEYDYSQERNPDESLESKFLAGRMALAPEKDYEASLGKVDEVWNIPLFN